jgi:hypothetical protein
MSTRKKPTEKYAEYKTEIRHLYSYIEAVLNGGLTPLEAVVFEDRYGTRMCTDLVLEAEWVDEVRVYTVTRGKTGKVYFNAHGFLPKVIEDMQGSVAWMDRDQPQRTQNQRIEQLKAVAARYDADGRRIREKPKEVESEKPGLCMTCGTQCVYDGSLAVLCPKCVKEGR